MSPLVPISWGELLDKITILEIKTERLTSEAALKNVRNELARLSAIVLAQDTLDPKIATLKAALKRVNETLWQIEDDIREKEAKKTFDEEFISLARAVYRNNDERGRIKRDINTLMKSELFEEKQYAAY
jgi:Family of unknown function (DUF6165)